MKVRNKTLVPRNPFAVAASQKKAGKHETSSKTQRQKDKQAIQKSLKAENPDKTDESNKAGAE